MTQKDKLIQRRMLELEVAAADVEESFIRSSGPGGSNANKVATCVYLKHTPTGIEVKCQQERTQRANRFLGWELLLDKIEALRQKQQRLEEFLRQKELRKARKKSQTMKERTLKAKHRQAEKKKLRAKIMHEDVD